MPIGTNIPVEVLEDLSGRITSETSSLETQLNALRVAVTREASFSGSAASKYDDFLTKWAANQAALIENMKSAGQILGNLAQVTRDNNDRVAGSLDS